MNALEEIFVKPKNSVFCRQLLATRQQQTDESVDQYLQSLKRLAKDCDFQVVTATQVRDEYIRDAFMNGITSNRIRQRLLENKTLEIAQRQLASYSQPDSLTASVSTVRTEEIDGCLSVCDEQPTVAAISGQKCFFYGNQRHDGPRSPARNSICKNCKKKTSLFNWELSALNFRFHFFSVFIYLIGDALLRIAELFLPRQIDEPEFS